MTAGLAVFAIPAQRDSADEEGEDDGDNEKKDGSPERNDQNGAHGERRDRREDPRHLVGEPVTQRRASSLHRGHLAFQRDVAGVVRSFVQSRVEADALSGCARPTAYNLHELLRSTGHFLRRTGRRDCCGLPAHTARGPAQDFGEERYDPAVSERIRIRRRVN